MLTSLPRVRSQTVLGRQVARALSCESAGPRVARAFFDAEEVRGSNPLAPTKRTTVTGGIATRWPCWIPPPGTGRSTPVQVTRHHSDHPRSKRRTLVHPEGHSA